jgi:hypothetical protein
MVVRIPCCCWLVVLLQGTAPVLAVLLHLRSISKPTWRWCDIPRTAALATENTIRVLLREHLGWRVEQKGQIRGTSPDTLPPQVCIALPRQLGEHVPLPFGLLGCPRQRTVMLVITAVIVRIVVALGRLAVLPRRRRGGPVRWSLVLPFLVLVCWCRRSSSFDSSSDQELPPSSSSSSDSCSELDTNLIRLLWFPVAPSTRPLTRHRPSGPVPLA